MQRRLSIFVDESGDFGFRGAASSLYLVSLIFHDQSQSLESSLHCLDTKLLNLGFPHHAIHTAPLIRCEDEYRTLDTKTRRAILYAVRQFLRHAPIQHKTFIFDKRHFTDQEQIRTRIARELGSFLRDNLELFQSYDSRVLYYDNGQNELGRVLNSTCNALLDIEIKREVKPSDYRLFQLADFICTLELMLLKAKDHRLSKKEAEFFTNNKTLKQLKAEIQRKAFH